MRQNKKENKNKRKNEEWLRKARHASSVKDIAHVIETMQFHRIFGLVDEQEVWDKLLILDEMYLRVFFIQEEKFRMQLKEKHAVILEKQHFLRSFLCFCSGVCSE